MALTYIKSGLLLWDEVVLTGIQSGLIPMTMGERTDEWTRKVPTPNLD